MRDIQSHIRAYLGADYENDDIRTRAENFVDCDAAYDGFTDYSRITPAAVRQACELARRAHYKVGV